MSSSSSLHCMHWPVIPDCLSCMNKLNWHWMTLHEQILSWVECFGLSFLDMHVKQMTCCHRLSCQLVTTKAFCFCGCECNWTRCKPHTIARWTNRTEKWPTENASAPRKEVTQTVSNCNLDDISVPLLKCIHFDKVDNNNNKTRQTCANESNFSLILTANNNKVCQTCFQRAVCMITSRTSTSMKLDPSAHKQQNVQSMLLLHGNDISWWLHHHCDDDAGLGSLPRLANWGQPAALLLQGSQSHQVSNVENSIVLPSFSHVGVTIFLARSFSSWTTCSAPWLSLPGNNNVFFF